MVKEWKIILDPGCNNDSKKLSQSKLKVKVEKIKELLETNPFQNPPPYEKLGGHAGRYSRRIDLKHRLVYEVYKQERIVKILRMWTHYGDN